ncbi:hypothetical protein AB0G86_25120 [Streptomyces scabiei]|uniref:hypothetical protein n=1 Tax=Streptomyces scabiei TaxID=1930 RepID=UPI003408979D
MEIKADTTGLRRDAENGVKRALSGLEGKVQLKASVIGLKAEARRKSKEALAGLSSDVKLKVDSTRLRASAEAAIKRATRGLNGSFELKFNAGALRTNLQARIKTATKGLKIHIPVHADATGLRAELRAAIAAAQAGLDMRIPVNINGAPLVRTLTTTNNALSGMSRRARMWTSAIIGLMGGIAPAIGTVINMLQAVGPAALVSVPMVSSLALVLGTVAVGGNGVAHAIAESAESAKDFNEALSKLTPEAQSFVKAVVSSKGAFKEMQSAIQDVLFSGLDDSFRTMAKQTLPDLQGGLGGTAIQLNQMAVGSMAVVESLSRTGTLKQAFGGLMLAFEPLIPMPGQFLNMLTKTTSAATPLFLRMTTSMGNGVDSLNAKVDRMFASGELQGNINRSAQSIQDFFRKIGSNPEWQKFVNNIKTTGPELAQVLGRIGEALLKLMNNAGPLFALVLKIADGFARLVNAIPDEIIATILGVAGAMKIMSLAGAGWAAITGSAAVASLTRFVTAARMTGVAAAIRGVAAAMTLLQKSTVVLAALSALVLVMSKLSTAGKEAPPNVDKLSQSLENFAKSGRVTGEMADKFGTKFQKLADIIHAGTNPSVTDSIDNWGKKWSGGLLEGAKSTDEMTEHISSLDQALASMVKGGNAEQAGVALQGILAGLKKRGEDTSVVTSKLKEYKQALQDQRIADEWAAKSMGVFGEAAVATSKRLEQLKSDTDGLAKSLFALNNSNRNAVDALGDWEAAADKLTEQAKKRAGALTYENGVISQNTQAQRENVDALNDYAAKTEAAGMASYQSNGNWQQSLGIWKQGHAELVRQAQQMGLSGAAAKAYADDILKIPTEKQIRLEMVGQAQKQLDSVVAAFEAAPKKKTITIETLSDTAIKVLKDLGYKVEKLPDGRFTVTANDKAKGKLDALSKYKVKDKDVKVTASTQTALGQLDGVIAKIRKTPDAKSITVKTLNAAAIKALEAVGYKVTHLKDGSVRVTAETGTASSRIAGIQAQRDRLSGKTITFTTVYRIVGRPGGPPDGSYMGSTAGRSAMGGLVTPKPLRFAEGGSISGEVLKGPGTKTSDSLIGLLSRGEFVMRAAAVDKYGPRFMQMVNAGAFPELPGFSVGGYTKKRTVGKGSSKKTQYFYQGQWMDKNAYDKAYGAAKQLDSLSTFSHFGKMAKAQGSFTNTEIESQLGRPGSVGDLVGSLNKTRGLIKASTSGKKESALLKQLDSSGKALLANQKKYESVNKALDKAKSTLDGLKQSFDQLKNSVASNILGFGNVTKAGKYGTSVDTLINQLQGDTSKATQFASMLDQLKAKGLNSQVLADIAEAGISGGGMATAQSLLGASEADINKINELQKQLTTAANAAGTTVADSMYGAGIKAAEGLVAGLTAQQKVIEATMMAIAKAMEASIKKALGIKSPSTVMMNLGSHVAEGFAIGIEQNERPKVASIAMAGKSPAAVSGSATTSSGIVINGGITVCVDGTFDLTNAQQRKNIANSIVDEVVKATRRHDRARS